MANPTATKTPFEHDALRASLRGARIREEHALTDLDPGAAYAGVAYAIRAAHAPEDVLGAIGSYRQRFHQAPDWFEWRYPQMLLLGPNR